MGALVVRRTRRNRWGQLQVVKDKEKRNIWTLLFLGLGQLMGSILPLSADTAQGPQSNGAKTPFKFYSCKYHEELLELSLSI